MLRIWRRVKENRAKLPGQEVITPAHFDSPYSYYFPNVQTVNPNQGYHQLLMILESRTQTNKRESYL
jgi:hypothetical protein